MTFGNKLAKMRKEKNYTQEQFAELLGVSRQAVSKWESDLAYPETDKLIRMCDLFDCSLDYLLRDKEETPKTSEARNPALFFGKHFHERKSKKTLWGLPLWHIGRNAKGIVAVGLNASGLLAVGLKAKGFLSFGLFSLGFLSFGLCSIGVIAIGLLALGLLSAGCLAVGILSAGAICFGIFALGALSVGEYSIGALALGKYVAIGDTAKAMIAIGDTQAIGTIYQSCSDSVTQNFIGMTTGEELTMLRNMIDRISPSYFYWASSLIKLFL